MKFFRLLTVGSLVLATACNSQSNKTDREITTDDTGHKKDDENSLNKTEKVSEKKQETDASKDSETPSTEEKVPAQPNEPQKEIEKNPGQKPPVVPTAKPMPAGKTATVPAALKGSWSLIEPNSPKGEGSPVGLPRSLRFSDGFVELITFCKDGSGKLVFAAAKSKALFSNNRFEILEAFILSKRMDGKSWTNTVPSITKIASGKLSGPQTCEVYLYPSVVEFSVSGDHLTGRFLSGTFGPINAKFESPR